MVRTLPELKSSLFLKAPSVLRNGNLAGWKMVAYSSNESGEMGDLRDFIPGATKEVASLGGGRRTATVEEGTGKRLFYIFVRRQIMAAPVNDRGQFRCQQRQLHFSK